MIKEASFLLIILLLFTIIGPKVLRWYYSISIAEPQGSYDFIIGKFKKIIVLILRYCAEACSEWRGSSSRLSA